MPSKNRGLVVGTPVGIGRSRISISAVVGLSWLKLLMVFLSVFPGKYGTLTINKSRLFHIGFSNPLLINHFSEIHN
jgi:hypothetical protein